MNYNRLTSEEEKIIVEKATEPPFIGKYDDFYEDGIFYNARKLLETDSSFNVITHELFLANPFLEV